MTSWRRHFAGGLSKKKQSHTTKPQCKTMLAKNICTFPIFSLIVDFPSQSLNSILGTYFLYLNLDSFEKIDSSYSYLISF